MSSSTSHPTPSAHQEAFIEKTIKDVKDKHFAPIMVYPFDNDYISWGSMPPDISKYYLKPLLIMAPHLNFPNVDVFCSVCKDGVLVPKGLDPVRRYIHDLKYGFYLIQYKYSCGNKHCRRNNERLVACSLLNEWPDYLRLAYGKIHLTHTSGISDDTLSLILHDAMSSKSFEEVGKTIAEFRVNYYVRLKTAYYTAVDCHIKMRQNEARLRREASLVGEINYPVFSSMDDISGFNEVPQPSNDYIIALYISEYLFYPFLRRSHSCLTYYY